MSELERIEALEKEIRKLKGLNDDGKKVYSFSKIRDIELNQLFDIEKKLNKNKFKNWFNNNINIDDNIIDFFNFLILENIDLISDYNEEDLKVNFIIPILNRVKFKSFEDEFRDFYELPLKYETEEFIFNGTTDFVVSKGLFKSQKPYFFIQEFKKGRVNSDPEPQLLAELIAGVELNNEKLMKGAYIVGAIWNFVILEKLGENKYQYFVSQNFDSTKIEDLKAIYKNLVFIKNDIIDKIKEESKIRI